MSTDCLAEPVSRAERSRRTRELVLAAHATEDLNHRADLLDEVIVLNRGVAKAIANRYRGRGVPEEDLQQTAYEGLIKAVHKFDPTVRADLLTYAVPTIRGEVQRWFRDHSWMIRPTRRVQELQWHVNRSIDRLSGSAGHTPTDEEISEAVGCSIPELHEALKAYGMFRPPSLDRPVGERGDATLGDLVVMPDDAHSAVEARVDLRAVLPTLPERDRTILYLRFFEDLSQSQIGERLGVTQMQVSRLLERILRELRTHMAPERAS